MDEQALDFLKAIIAAPSPSGFEQPVAWLFRDYVQPAAHKVTTDIMGNVSAVINPDAPVRFMYAGHMDEVGFIVHHIDENGFLFFNTIGGTDVATEIGQRVQVHGHETVPGVVGRKAIQTFKAKDSNETPTLKDLWIDIGASSRAEAEKVVHVGSPVTLDAGFATLSGQLAVGRAFDNKVGLLIGAQLVHRLARDGGLHPEVGFHILGTVQEEIGSRGAKTAGFNIAPRTALAVDMGVAMDYPRARPEDQGRLDLGRGPGILQGANTNPVVFDLLVAAAEEKGIPWQHQASGGTSPTDARVIQELQGGVATGLISVPLRYMHTPSEVVCLDDIQATIDLVHEYCLRLRPDTDFTPM
ncbi:M42 family metallopeptidase [Paracoccus shandongensis]|uniref:M42 family metallopeptidase n=1 Tax=Paracoccus shandongensis TaxID=2816048 RepID=UPI001A8ECC64|nr:M20/M25/M40 family metallo-hydrolase [Paracoccus shandongensis]